MLFREPVDFQIVRHAENFHPNGVTSKQHFPSYSFEKCVYTNIFASYCIHNAVLSFSGRNPAPLWDSDGQRSDTSSEPSARRPAPFRPVGTFDYDPMPYLPVAYQVPGAGGVKKKEGESYKEISRRLDCKYLYIIKIMVYKNTGHLKFF